jgi:hypothetical protein
VLEPAERRGSDFALFTNLSQDLLLHDCKGFCLVNGSIGEEGE